LGRPLCFVIEAGRTENDVIRPFYKGDHLSEAVKIMSKTISTMATTSIAASETLSDVLSFVSLTFSRILQLLRICGWILSGWSAQSVVKKFVVSEANLRQSPSVS
jgi:hypothetical protein